MRVYVINHHKLRVELDEPELLSYGIDYENLKYDAPQTKEIIHSAIERAKLASGIDFKCPRMLIEAKMSGSKIIFFVTKIESKSAFDDLKKSALKNSSESSTCVVIGLENLCGWASSAENFGVGGRCCLYRKDENYMIEFLDEIDQITFSYLCSEFEAQIVKNPYHAAYLQENWEIIAYGIPFLAVSQLYG